MSPEEVAERLKELERDRTAWNLPSPPTEVLRRPPDTEWPPWPFEAATQGDQPLKPAA